MKILITLLMIACVNISFAVGWEEITKENIVNREIVVDLKMNTNEGCNEVKVTLPKTTFFQYLGDRDFWTVSYKNIEEKTRGWQLTSKGTQIKLPSFTEGAHIKIEGICLSDDNLKTAYLSAHYLGPQGTVPMVILIKLGDFK